MRQYVVMPLKDQCLNHPSVQAGLKSLSCFTHRKNVIWFSNLNMPLFLYYLLGNLLNKWLDKSFGILINNLTNCQMFTKKYSQPTESNAFSAWRLRTKVSSWGTLFSCHILCQEVCSEVFFSIIEAYSL